MISDFKEMIALNLKNIYGWKTNRRIVVFSIDDYGNVRLDSKSARTNMDKAGMKIYSQFDAFDTLETTEDLEMLFDVLSSVKDKNGNNAVFTAFAVPANIDFEKMKETGYEEYIYEVLPETFKKLKGYEGTWSLWKDGIKNNLIIPQFHGREHLNLKIFKDALKIKDHNTLTALRNRSYTSIPKEKYSTISPTAAFEFWEFNENKVFNEIIKDGLNLFEKIFGFRSDHFNAPGGSEHKILHQELKNNGIKYIDTPLIKHEHQGNGKYKTYINYTGKKNSIEQVYMVRNCVFEPAVDKGISWDQFCLKQIEASFRWNRPAVISSHRVNFCGHIDPENRKNGLKDLKNLLQAIVKKWPDVEFMSANALCDIIARQN